MKCLLDLDGVLADFQSGWYQANPQYIRPEPWPNGVWSLSEVHGITFEQSCSSLSANFWSNLPWMPDGRMILKILENHFRPENICILTSNHVTYAAVAAFGKVHWIERELPEYKYRYLLGASKYFLAHEDVVLIDDKNENVDLFRANGGSAFLIPRPWNRDYARCEFVFDDLIEILRYFA